MPCCSSVFHFVLAYAAFLFCYHFYFAFTSAAIVTMERRFGWSSTYSGIFITVFEVTHVGSVLVFSFTETNVHIPRRLGWRALFMATGSTAVTLSHFIYESDNYQSSKNHTIIEFYCSKNLTVSDTFSTILEDEKCDRNIIISVSSCTVHFLGFVYIDNNASKTKAPLYVGIVQLFKICGPFCAVFFSGYLLRIPVDPFADNVLPHDDPRFIGAWWSGYLLCSVSFIIIGLYLFTFPAPLQHSRPPLPEETFQIGNLPSVVKSLFKNTIWMLLCVFWVLLSWNTMLGTLYPKVAEAVFRRPTANANMETALFWPLPAALGSLAGGYFMSKLSPRFWVIALLGAFAVAGIFSAAFLTLLFQCPQMELLESVSTICTDKERTCDDGVYEPVCDSSNKYFLSPCQAGCNVTVTGDWDYCDVTSGYCTEDCPTSQYTAYAMLMYITAFITNLLNVPYWIIVMRVVAPEHKSVSMGLGSLICSLFAWSAAPPIAGVLMHAACLRSSSECGKSNCLLYDTDQLVKIVHIMPAILNLPGVLVLLALAYFCKKNISNEYGEEPPVTSAVSHFSDDPMPGFYSGSPSIPLMDVSTIAKS